MEGKTTKRKYCALTLLILVILLHACLPVTAQDDSEGSAVVGDEEEEDRTVDESAYTHTIDTKGDNGIYLQFDNGASLIFDSEYISIGDSNGLWSWRQDSSGNTIGAKFYNLKMGTSECPNPWYIEILGSACVTIKQLFNGEKFVATVTGTLGVKTITIYCGSKGRPTQALNTYSYAYAEASQEAEVKVEATSQEITLSWVPTRGGGGGSTVPSEPIKPGIPSEPLPKIDPLEPVPVTIRIEIGGLIILGAVAIGIVALASKKKRKVTRKKVAEKWSKQREGTHPVTHKPKKKHRTKWPKKKKLDEL